MTKLLASSLLCAVFMLVPLTSAAQPATPTNLKAFAGGTSIALRWDSTSLAVQHRVYRDGILVATRGRGFDWLFPEKDGQGYIDRGATPGKTYRYEVQAVAANGALSPKSAVLAVAFPAKTTPVPKIELGV